jgi:hypothetical protein
MVTDGFKEAGGRQERRRGASEGGTVGGIAFELGDLGEERGAGSH